MPFAQQQQPRVDVVEAMREFSNFQGKECVFFLPLVSRSTVAAQIHCE